MIEHLYLHVPFCKTICFYCDFCHRIYNQELVDKWLIELEKEIQSKKINKSLKTIYIGGGTPSSLSSSQLDKLLSLLDPYSLEIIEYTVEINPETINQDKIDILIKHHVNRVSIGIQSFNDDLLKMMNRHHKKEDVYKTIELFRSNGIHNITCDLIYSLPSQTIDMFLDDIKELIKLDIPHISFYSLTIEDNTVFKKLKYNHLDSDTEYMMYEKARELLNKSGYSQYEISNYAKEGYESKHNLCYWHYEDYYGISIGASGKENNIRYDNTKSFDKYFESEYIENKINLDKNDLMFENIMMESRLKEGIDLKSFYKKYGIYFEDYYKDILKNNKNIKIVDNHAYFNRDILNTVLIDFLP